MSKAHWQHYSHPADMGIRGFGPTKQEAFAQAALALTAIIADLQTIDPKEMVQIICNMENDDELLFVNWLNTLLYHMSVKNMLFSRFEIKLSANRLHAKAWGENIDKEKHRPAVEVKAATYADLKVGPDKNGNWMAQCIVDV